MDTEIWKFDKIVVMKSLNETYISPALWIICELINLGRKSVFEEEKNMNSFRKENQMKHDPKYALQLDNHSHVSKN